MPALRSPKGKTVAKNKATTRPRPHLKDNVDPCEICGVVVSRKSDVPRHAKRHASDAEKLPCPWEGCTFRTLQKSNLDTHYRRHTKDKSYNCTDDPECGFQTCDPASLLRHRKRLHGYTPRATVGYKTEKPYAHVPVRIIRGCEVDSGSIASQFSAFSSGPSASQSTSSTPASHHWPLPSLSPPPPPPATSYSHPYPYPPYRSFSRLHSSGESEVTGSSLSTPLVSDRELSPERSSMIVFSMTSAPVYPIGKSLLLSDSLLLPFHTKNYAWGLSRLDPLLAPGVSVSPSPLSPGSGHLEFQCSEEEETSDQPISVLNKFALPLWLLDIEKTWPGYKTAGQLSGSEGLKQAQSSWATAKFNNQVTSDMSINDNSFQSHSFPMGLSQSGLSDESYNSKLEICSPVLNRLELETGFERGVDVDSGSVELPALSSTLEATPVSTHIHYDITTHTTSVASLDSIIGDQSHDITTNDNPNTEPDFINVNTNVDLNHYGINTGGGDDDDVSSSTFSNYLIPTQWDILRLDGLDGDLSVSNHHMDVREVL